MKNVLINFVVALVLLEIDFGSSRIVTEAPRTVTKNKEGLIVKCSPVITPDVEEILYIRLRSDKDGPMDSRKSKIARVSKRHDLQYAKWMDSRYIISGSVLETSSAFLSLEILPEDVECSDAATYRCEMVYRLTNSSYVSSASDYTVTVSEVDEAVSNAKSRDVFHDGEFLYRDTFSLTCSAITGNLSNDIKWCYGSDNVVGNDNFRIENETKNFTQHRKCTFLVQSEITIQILDPNVLETLWFACSLHGCDSVNDSKKYYFNFRNGNEDYGLPENFIQREIRKEDPVVFSSSGVDGDLDVGSPLQRKDTTFKINDRMYFIGGLILAGIGVIALVISSLVYAKARRQKYGAEHIKSKFEEMSRNLSISYSCIDDEKRPCYSRISKSTDNIRDENPYTSLGDLNKYEETKTSYMSMVSKGTPQEGSSVCGGPGINTSPRSSCGDIYQ